MLKTIYFVRDAKKNSFSKELLNYERTVSKKGLKDIKTIGSYLQLRDISCDLILSSFAMGAQETAINLASKIGFFGQSYFLQELYYAPYEDALKIIMAQEDVHKSIMVIGHTPQLNELVNHLAIEHIKKIPEMGIVALKFDLESWSELKKAQAEIEFFIYPKQFKYYMSRQIRAVLKR